MQTRSSLLLLAVMITLMCAAGCTSPQQSSSPAPTVQTISIPPTPDTHPGTFILTVDSFNPGSALPETYTCKGAGESPEVSWSGIPPGTESLVLILDDPDAPRGTFTHWLIYNIPPVAGSISSARPNQEVLGNGAQRGDNSAGSRGYYPPCPPVGAVHRYVFRLYAVDMDISQPAAGRESIDQAMTGHILGKTEVVTIFQR